MIYQSQFYGILKVYSQSENTQIDGEHANKLIKVIGGSGDYTLKDTIIKDSL